MERPAALTPPRAAIPAAIDALRAGRSRDRVDWRTEARRLAGDLEHARWLLRALQDRCDGYQRTVEAQDRHVYALTREVETLRALRREQPVAVA